MAPYQSYILIQGRNQSFDFVARVTFCERLKVCYMITTCCMWKDRTNSRPTSKTDDQSRKASPSMYNYQDPLKVIHSTCCINTLL